GMRFSYPSILKATAASGSIYLGASAWTRDGVAEGYGRAENLGVWFRPSSNSTIELLAMDHLYGGGYSLSSSSAPQTILATPFQPAIILRDGTGAEIYNNIYQRLGSNIRSPFAFGAN